MKQTNVNIKKQKIGYHLNDYDYKKYSSSENMTKNIIDSIEKRDSGLIKFSLLSKGREIRVLSIFDTDYGDIRCNAILMLGGREVANIIASYEKSEFEYLFNNNFTYESDIVKNHFKVLILKDYSLYNSLPKISYCSDLLQEIYDNVCYSDSCMCHVDKYDWDEIYSDRYTESDIDILKKEIKEYGLDEVIEVNAGEYKIVGYGDLETRFNDDRNLQKYVIKNMEIENTGGYVMVYYGELESGEWYLHSDLNDDVVIYDKKPFDNDYYADEYKWHNRHLITEIQNKDAKEMFRKMDSFIDKIAIEPNWNKTFHKHFQNMLEIQNQKKDYEYGN